MFSVALIGPDGAGKTTVGQRIEKWLPLPVKYVYMGVSKDSSNLMLPTTRLVRFVKRAMGAAPDNAGPPDPNRVKQPPKGKLKQLTSGLRAWLRLINNLSEELYRQGAAWYYQRRGNIVLFDRHYFSDYHAYDISNENQQRTIHQRIHGFFLNSIYPKPDLVIYLDAPGSVLFARKGEGSVEALERRRQDYFKLQDVVKHFIIVDATQPLDMVTEEVTKSIWNFYTSSIEKPMKVRNVSE